MRIRLNPVPANRWLVAGLTALASLAAACGSSQSFRGSVYRDDETSFRVGTLPAAWRRVEIDHHNDLAFENHDTASVIQVNGSCDPSLDIPLVSLTNHLLIGFTEREIESQETVSLARREALRTHVIAKLDGVPREMLLVVVKKNECVFDFALVGPPGLAFERTRGDYDALLAGFSTEGAAQ